MFLDGASNEFIQNSDGVEGLLAWTRWKDNILSEDSEMLCDDRSCLVVGCDMSGAEILGPTTDNLE